ncbi:glutathione S-transferase [Verticiella sediminum]|uniref:Glutathione S-transferase n=1 Tax=Verticiella sediminum TaxID=1247510 RepID=A0A556AS42_9BURK|nr:glutathione S-transferase [Verticiella sediminum]TSH95759.1 glutathione S-transferase [Verticiella sediminum]
MLELHGFSISNYYNKVKLALLEMEVEFKEVQQPVSQEEAMLRYSPLGKVPFIMTDEGPISESHTIVEYLEDAYPQVSLFPQDVYHRAKCRELIQYLELHVELVARKLYPQAFFGAPKNADLNASVRRELERNLKALARLARFDPYFGGPVFSQADCAAIVHLPLVGSACRQVYGEDLLAEALGADRVKRYLEMVGERPHVRRVGDDRKQAARAAAAAAQKK